MSKCHMSIYHMSHVHGQPTAWPENVETTVLRSTGARARARARACARSRSAVPHIFQVCWCGRLRLITDGLSTSTNEPTSMILNGFIGHKQTSNCQAACRMTRLRRRPLINPQVTKSAIPVAVVIL